MTTAIPPRLLHYVDRELIQVEPIGSQFQGRVVQDDVALFTGKLWPDFSDAASEAYEGYLNILDERAQRVADDRERDEVAAMTPGERLDYYRAEGA